VPAVTARAELELGRVLERTGNHEAAVRRYRAAIDSPQQQTSLHAAFNLAGLLRDSGGSPEQLAESRHYLEQVHASGHPGYAPKAAVDLAVGLLEQERADEAVPLLEEGAASADPAVSALAHFHLGLVLIDVEQARRHLRIAQKTGTGQVKTRAAEALRLRRG
jgi:predicted negative regulator of RcsB-dependent stress response